MLKIQSAQKFMLALLAFSGLTASTTFSAAANIPGSHAGLYSSHQAAVKISQSNNIDPYGVRLTPEQKARIEAFAREFTAKFDALQKRQNSGQAVSMQQVQSLAEEYTRGMNSLVDSIKREQSQR